MTLPIFAVDVDNTLLIEGPDGRPVVNEAVRDLIRALHQLGVARIVIWSGGGADYAEAMARRCAVDQYASGYAMKATSLAPPAFTLDDQKCTLGVINLRLPGDIEPTPYMGIG